MRRLITGWMAGVLLLFVSAAGAQENPFKTKNPDVDKYAFTKNFIIGLGYYHRVADRLKAEVDVSSASTSDMATIQTFIDNRTLDNTELRIARNYLTRFLSSRNGLIRKIAADAGATYDALIAMSMKERELWQAFHDFKTESTGERLDEEDFVRQQTAIAIDKKEMAKGLLEASLLIRIVLLDARRCDNEECRMLAITQKERDKLLEKLDVFAGNNMAWGVKAGQSTVEACEAAIREILEDPVYQSL